eukprot:COSAG06_NODE_28644_length_570_cov_1.515924_1_plen_45_part_10
MACATKVFRPVKASYKPKGGVVAGSKPRQPPKPKSTLTGATKKRK